MALGEDAGRSICLGCTSAAGDDVGGSGTPTTPVLGRRSINSLLGRGIGVDSSHEPLNNTELVVDDLSERGQTVSGARSVREDLDVLGIFLEVDTADEHGGVG